MDKDVLRAYEVNEEDYLRFKENLKDGDFRRAESIKRASDGWYHLNGISFRESGLQRSAGKKVIAVRCFPDKVSKAKGTIEGLVGANLVLMGVGGKNDK